MDSEYQKQIKSALGGKIIRRVLFFLVLLVLLMMVAGLILQIPAVQNYARQKTEKYLVGKLDRPVSIEKIKLKWFNQFELKNLLITNQSGDTSIYSGAVIASIDMDILDLFNGRISIHKIALRDLTLHHASYAIDSSQNLSLIVRKLFPPKTNGTTKQTKNKSVDLDLKSIALENIWYTNDSEYSNLKFYLKSGQLEINDLDLMAKKFILDEMSLQGIDVGWHQLKKSDQGGGFDLFGDSTLFIAIQKLRIDDNNRLTMSGWPEHSFWNQLKSGFQGLEIHGDSLLLADGKITGKIPSLRAITEDSVGISFFTTDQLSVSAHKIDLNAYELRTAHSILKDSLELNFDGFSAFRQFADLVRIDLRFNQSKIAIKDLIKFVPAVGKNDFFRKHENESILLNGPVLGTVNEFIARGLTVSMGNLFHFEGNAEVSQLANPNDAFFIARIKSLQSQATVIQDLIKGTAGLKNFNKLGKLEFKGNFDGSLKDFVAYGLLNTSLGSSKMDMRLNNARPDKVALYSGEMELFDFDLGTYMGNKNVGKVSLNTVVKEGRGFTSRTAAAKLQATLKKFEYKGYTYTNGVFNGTLNNRLLDGTVLFNDPNTSLGFKGKIDFTGNEPILDFDVDINKLDLHALHLVKDTLALAGKVHLAMRGKNIDDLKGDIVLKSMVIQKDSDSVTIDQLQLNAIRNVNGDKRITVKSDVLDGYLEGQYRFNQLWPSLKNQLIKQFPDIASTLKLTSDQSKLDTGFAQSYNFDMHIKDARPIKNLLNVPIAAKLPFQINGIVNSAGNYLLANWNIPDLTFNQTTIQNSIGRLEAKGGFAFTSSRIDSAFSSDFHMPYMVLTADLARNKMNFAVSTPKVTNLVNNIDLNGTLELIDSTYHMKLSSSKVSFLDRNWDILKDNEIIFRKGYVQTKNLQFVHNKEKIVVYSEGDKGIKADISNLDIDWVNKLLPLKEWKLSGKLNLKAESSDVFSLKGLRVAGLVDSLYINKSYFGLIDLHAQTPNTKQPIQISLSMLDGSRQLLGQGFYDITGLHTGGTKNNYQFKFIFKDYPLRIFEYLIDDIIDNTKGNIQGNLEIRKINNQPDFNGQIRIKGGGLKVNYLGTSYTIADQPVKITNNAIDVSGVVLWDEQKNPATLSGGIVHKRFKDFSLDAGIRSPRFLVLKTTKEQNKDYYGTLIGNVVATFKGPFNRIDIDVKGVSARPSTLNIPVSQATVTTSDRIVQYRPKKTGSTDTIKSKRILAAKGISVGIDLTVNEDVDIALIFDEKRGDILKGTGVGDMQMKFDRTGEISMYGNYEVNRGEYLFTLFGLVNKPFTIRQGGTIRWDGDPLGAQINLSADYKGLTSSLINLLPEYEGAIDARELRAKAPIELLMNLYGDLFKPEISFDLAVPNLTGNLRSIVENKLSILKADQNALNQQVLGLVVWGSFLPPNQLVASSGILGSTINNFSQFISNQLSLLVENALKEFVSEDNALSSFDFDVNYFNNANQVDINNVSVFDELNINLGPKFFDDRLALGLGADFINSTAYDRLITPHFEVEYSLTQDRRLKIKAYVRKDDLSQGQLRDRIGGGISWRKEFNNIEDFKNQLRRSLNKEL